MNLKVVSLLAVFGLATHTQSQTCDMAAYAAGPHFCITDPMNITNEVCGSMDTWTGTQSLTVNPVTGEYWALVSDWGVISYGEEGDGLRRLVRFNASLSGDGMSIDMSNFTIVRDDMDFNSGTDGDIILSSLTFTCSDSDPLLLGITGQPASSDFIYLIDQNNGSFTTLMTVDKPVGFKGNSIVYNLDDKLLYYFANFEDDNAISVQTIDLGNLIAGNYGSESELITYIGQIPEFGSDDKIQLAAFYDENYMFMATRSSTNGKVFLQSLENVSDPIIDVSTNGIPDQVTSTQDPSYSFTKGIVCLDWISRCLATFTDEPSYNPTTMPSSVPSNMPSNMPSNDPTAMPSNNPSVMPSSMPSSEPTPMPADAQDTNMPSNMPTAMPNDMSTTPIPDNKSGTSPVSVVNVMFVSGLIAICSLLNLFFCFK